MTTYFLEERHSREGQQFAWRVNRGVLGVSGDVAQDITARRERNPFASIVQLREAPGVDASRLEQRKSRILFWLARKTGRPRGGYYDVI